MSIIFSRNAAKADIRLYENTTECEKAYCDPDLEVEKYDAIKTKLPLSRA